MRDEGLYKRLLARCTEEGECLIWGGPFSASGVPVLNTRHKPSARKAYYRAVKAEPAPEMVFPSTCKEKRCIRHTKPMTLSEARSYAASQGAYKGKARTLKRTAAQRAKSKFSEETIQAMRDAGSAREAQELSGASLAYVYEVRRGLRRAPFTNPFAALGI